MGNDSAVFKIYITSVSVCKFNNVTVVSIYMYVNGRYVITDRDLVALW